MHITKAKRKKVVDLYQKGYTTRVIGKKLNISKSMAGIIVKNFKILGEEYLNKMGAHKNYTAEEKYNIIQEYLSGESFSNLAIKHRIPGGQSTISRWFKKYLEFGYNGIVNKKQGRPELSMKETNNLPEETVLNVDEKKRLKQLEQENLQLKAEIAYLKKLKALIQSRPEQQKKKK